MTRIWLDRPIARRRVIAGAVGLAAYGVARAHAQGTPALRDTVIVGNRLKPSVKLLRGGEIVGRIDLPFAAWQLAISEPHGLLVASDRGTSVLEYIDLASGRSVGRLQLDHEPEHMQLDPSGEVLAVGNFYASRVGLVRLAEPTRITDVQGLPEPHNFGFTRDSTTLVVATMGRDSVGLVDVASGKRVDEVAVVTPGLRNQPVWRERGYVGITDLTLSRDTRFVLAVPTTGSELGVVDLTLRKQVASIAVGDTPWRAYASATGDRFAVPNVGDGTVSLISAEGWRETARIEGGGDMTWAIFAFFDSTVLVNDRATRSLLVIDALAGKRVADIPLPGEPEAAALDPTGTRLLVTLVSTGEVAVIDPQARAVERVITVGGEPHVVATLGSLNYCN